MKPASTPQQLSSDPSNQSCLILQTAKVVAITAASTPTNSFLPNCEDLLEKAAVPLHLEQLEKEFVWGPFHSGKKTDLSPHSWTTSPRFPVTSGTQHVVMAWRLVKLKRMPSE
jgi:hypothetical protein